MYQRIIECILGWFQSAEARLQRAESLRLKQADAIVEMSMKLVEKYETRLEAVETALTALRTEVDEAKTAAFKYQGTIADLERRLKVSEERERGYEVKIAEMKRNYESTIAELEGRISELEEKQNAGT